MNTLNGRVGWNRRWYSLVRFNLSRDETRVDSSARPTRHERSRTKNTSAARTDGKPKYNRIPRDRRSQVAPFQGRRRSPRTKKLDDQDAITDDEPLGRTFRLSMIETSRERSDARALASPGVSFRVFSFRRLDCKVLRLNDKTNRGKEEEKKNEQKKQL